MTTSVLLPGSRPGGGRGQALLEFSLVSIMLIMLVFGVIEIGRIMLVYSTVSDAARVGTRYAIVNGSDVFGSTAAAQTAVQSVVNSYLAAGPINTANATVNVAYPAGMAPGCQVTVTVSYPYQAMLGYYGFSITVNNTSQGVITW